MTRLVNYRIDLIFQKNAIVSKYQILFLIGKMQPKHFRYRENYAMMRVFDTYTSF